MTYNYRIYEVVDNDAKSLLISKDHESNVSFALIAQGDYDDLIRIAADLNELHDLKQPTEEIGQADEPVSFPNGVNVNEAVADILKHIAKDGGPNFGGFLRGFGA